MRRSARALRTGAILSAALVGVVSGVVALPAHRPLGIFVAVIALAIVLGADLSGDTTVRAVAIGALGTAAAISFIGAPRATTAISAAIAGVLIAAFAELSRWAHVLTGAIEASGHPVSRGLATSGAVALAGGVGGWAVVAGGRGLSGLGLGALAFGVLAAVAFAVTVAVARTPTTEGSGPAHSDSDAPTA